MTKYTMISSGPNDAHRSFADENNRPRTLSDIMEFDHVIRVNKDGRITDDIGTQALHAPELHDGEVDGSVLHDQKGRPLKWDLMTGYTGQYGYRGPIMHSSEFIGGGLADDILATPGLYVALVNYCSADDSEAVDDTDTGTVAEGWAVARILDGE
jgi:hypothetical protein